MDEPVAVPFFLYGTARQGQPLHSMVEDIVEDIWVATAPNTRLMVISAAYPYLVECQDELVYGDVALLRTGPDLTSFVQMELNVGYSLEAVRVEPVFDNDPQVSFALAFVWRGSQRDMWPLGYDSWLDYSNSKRLSRAKNIH